MRLKVKGSPTISGKVDLPVSKSFMNRYLMLRKLCGAELPEMRSNFPDDVKIFAEILSAKTHHLFAGDAGTAMRFLTAYFSLRQGEFLLDGSERMRERPIGILVDALNELGAEISYLEALGYPPLKIKGSKLKGGKIVVKSDVSSQFLSALLMVAPLCESEVCIEIEGRLVSESYVQLTIELMKRFGVQMAFDGSQFIVKPQQYNVTDLKVEFDWSSAAFIYGMAAVSDVVNVSIPGLNREDLQGDMEVIRIFKKMNVQSTFTENGLALSKTNGVLPTMLEIDFTTCPDLVQVVAMTCAALNIRLELNGLYNLHLKETNRLKALEYNLNQIGCSFETNGNMATMRPGKLINRHPVFKSFNDHRMTMSLMPLTLILPEIEIPDSEVVSKSFPNFWVEMKKIGLMVHEII